MKQSALNLKLNVKKTRKQVFPNQVYRADPCAVLVNLIALGYPKGKPVECCSRLNPCCGFALRSSSSYLDSAMEEAFFASLLARQFAQFDTFESMPDDSTILGFRYWLAKHKRAEKIPTIVNDLILRVACCSRLALLSMPH